MSKQNYRIEAKVEFTIKAKNAATAIDILKYKLNGDEEVFCYYGDSMRIIKEEEDPYDE